MLTGLTSGTVDVTSGAGTGYGPDARRKRLVGEVRQAHGSALEIVVVQEVSHDLEGSTGLHGIGLAFGRLANLYE